MNINEINKLLVQTFSLPPKTRKFILTAEVDCLPIVELEVFFNPTDYHTAQIKKQRFTLTPLWQQCQNEPFSSEELDCLSEMCRMSCSRYLKLLNDG